MESRKTEYSIVGNCISVICSYAITIAGHGFYTHLVGIEQRTGGCDTAVVGVVVVVILVMSAVRSLGIGICYTH